MPELTAINILKTGFRNHHGEAVPRWIEESSEELV
jgi:hypothetical protein